MEPEPQLVLFRVCVTKIDNEGEDDKSLSCLGCKTREENASIMIKVIVFAMQIWKIC